MFRRRTVCAPTRPQRGAAWRVALWAVAVLAALALLWTLAVGWWLPRFLQPRVEAAVTTTLGTPFSIGRIEIAPWRLAVTASDLRLGPVESPWLRVARVEGDVSSESFVRLAPVLEALSIVEPSLRLERLAPGRFNVSPVIETLARRRAAEGPQPMALHNLTLTNGSILLVDDVTHGEHRVEALQIGVPFVSNLPADVKVHVEPLLAARIDGSPLRLTGRTLPFSAGRTSSLDIDWRDVDLPHWLEALAPLLPGELPIELRGGKLEAVLRVAFEQREAGAVPLLQIGGRLALTQLEARVPARGVGLAAPRLEIDGLDLRPLERRAVVARIAWQAPAVDIDLPTLRSAAGAGDTGQADGRTDSKASAAAASPTATASPASDPGSAPAGAAASASRAASAASATSSAPPSASSPPVAVAPPASVSLPASAALPASGRASLKGASAPDAVQAASAAAQPSTSASHAAAPAASSPTGSSSGEGGWQWRVEAIEVLDASVRLRDPAWPEGQRVAPISLRLQGLDGRAEAAPATLALALTDAGGARLAVDGSVAPARGTAKLRLDLQDLAPGPWLAPWQSALPVRWLDGRLQLQAAMETGAEGWSLREGALRLTGMRLEPVGAVQAVAAAAGPQDRPRRAGRAGAHTPGPGATGRAAPRERRADAPRATAQATAAAPVDRLALAALALDGLRVDGRPGRSPVVRVDTLTLDGLDVHATRTAAGRFAWAGDADSQQPSRRPSADAAAAATATGPARPAPPAASTASVPAAEPAWSIGELRCNGCGFAFNDAALRPTAMFGVKDARFMVREYGADPTRPVDFELAAQSIGGGRLKAAGSVRPQPLALRSRIDIDALELRGLQPYLDPHLNVALASARAQAAGELRLDGDPGHPVAAAQWRGRLGLAELRALDRQNDADLLRWRSLRLDGADLRWTPARLEADLGSVALEGFYGRVIVNADGRLNLQDIVRREGETGSRSITTPSPAPSTGAAPNPQAASVAADTKDMPPQDGTGPGAAPASAPAGAETSRGEPTASVAPRSAPGAASPAPPGPKATTPGALPASVGPAASAPAGTAAAAGPHMRWRAIRLADGTVDFSDHFIRPNYSAQLTDLNGEVAALAWDDPQPAAVTLSGKVDGSAPLEVSGTVHPLGPRIATDITASARGIDITRLTAYSGRYAGYGIEKGTLSLQVHYKLDNGRLEAQNKLRLDQLTFGDKVDSPDALKLPVLLAVSLLKDRHGVIDVDLPISGSLDDPQFSIGGIIVRVIVNLVTKALTAPFSLLASAFGGGGEELGHIEFAAGTSELDDAARARLDKLAAALADRPTLKLEATGHADPASDAEGLRARHVERLLRAAKARATGEPPERVTIGPDERSRWLEEAYKAADLQGKPRNLLGFAKGGVPPEQMEALLRDGAAAGEAALKALANERGDRVKAYLVTKVPAERVLLSASRLGPGGEGKEGPGGRRVEFALK